MKVNEVDFPTRLNMNADKLASANSKPPMNTYILSIPFAVYVNAKYFPLTSNER